MENKLSKILDYLKDNLTMRIKTENPFGDEVNPFDNTWVDEKFLAFLVKNHWKKNSKLYCLSVWNSGRMDLVENYKYCQGEIVSGNNNTDFRYFILISGNKVKIFGFERKYYGIGSVFSRIPYEFSIK